MNLLKRCCEARERLEFMEHERHASSFTVGES